MSPGSALGQWRVHRARSARRGAAARHRARVHHVRQQRDRRAGGHRNACSCCAARAASPSTATVRRRSAKCRLDLHRLDVDLASFTAHKLYGPKGIGALYVRAGTRAWLRPLMHGGGQEHALRPGTLPTHQIAGFGAALRAGPRAHERRACAGRSAGASGCGGGSSAWAGTHLNGAAAARLPGIVNVSFEGVNGESLVDALGALAYRPARRATPSTREPSYVLRALGRDTQLAQSSLRFSLGRYTSDADIEPPLRR